MKKVLIISYYFPPSGGAGVHRILKFVKYLPEFGWQPFVLTVNEEADFPARDVSLLKEVPEAIEVFRTKIFEPYNLYRKFTGRKKEEPTDIASLAKEVKKSLTNRLSEWIRATFFIPDARRFWKKPAVKQGMKIVKDRDIDLIFSTAPPYTCHLIGKTLKKKTGLSWVADFRDSWIGWLSTPERWFLPHMIDNYFERSVLERADTIVTVSNGIREDLLSRNPHIDSKKWRIIPNGFDEEDFKNVYGKASGEKFVLTYTGSLYGNRNPKMILKALEKLFENHPSIRKRFTVRFVGRVDQAFLKDFKQFSDVVEYIPYVPHKESIRYMLNSSVLLLIIDAAPVNHGILTGKLFEYIGAKKPILALAPEGEAADLIEDIGLGKVVPPNDPETIKKALFDYFTQWENGRLSLKTSGNRVKHLERKSLTKELAKVFDDIIQTY